MNIEFFDINRKCFSFFGISLLILSFFIIQGCNSDKLSETGFTINGNIKGADDGKVTLSMLDLETNEKVNVDTTDIKDGKFFFCGKLDTPYLYTIVFNEEKKKKGIYFFLENCNMDIVGNINQTDKIKTSGSREDTFFRSYNISSMFEKETGLNIMTKHPDYIVSAFVAYYYFQINNLKLEKMESIINNFSEPVKKSVYFKYLTELYNRIKLVAVSKPAPDFSLPDNNGRMTKLKEFRGKYVLIDFWASWCAPCRKSNPKLVNAYKIFKDRNFTIIGISVDTKRKKWLKAIKDDGLVWTNLSEIKGWSDITNLYGVKAVPQNFLIDPKGIIIKKNIEPEKLVEVLNKIIPAKAN